MIPKLNLSNRLLIVQLFTALDTGLGPAQPILTIGAALEASTPHIPPLIRCCGRTISAPLEA